MNNQMEFAVFCIENIAKVLQENGTVAYRQLAEDTDILSNYILPNYEVLHSQGKEYILEDILDIMREAGIVA